MPNWSEKVEIAEKEGAHVAAVLYLILCAEEHRGSDYHWDAWRETSKSLLQYGLNLKKCMDRTALEEFAAFRYGHALGMDYCVDITARLDSVRHK